MAMTGHPFPLTVLRHKALADQHGSGQYNDRDRKHNAELLFMQHPSFQSSLLTASTPLSVV